jgi:hypothetical protein
MTCRSSSRRRRRATALLLAAISASTATARAADVVSSWAGPAFGTESWSNAANWVNTPAVAHYPNNGNGGFTYDAILNVNGTALLSEPITLQTLTLDAGTIEGDFNLTINQNMTWTGGEMRGINGTTTIPVGATLTLSGPTRRTLTRTLNMFGTTTWTDGGGFTGDSFAGLGIFNNHGTFFANSSFVATGAMGIGTFNNPGTIRKTAGLEARFGGITKFLNTGTVSVNTGSIFLVREPLNSQFGTLSGGNWIVDAVGSANGARLQMTGPAITTLASTTRVELIGANSTFLSVDSLSDNQGVFRIASGRHFATVGTLSNSGTLIVGRDTALTATGTLTNSGTMDVSGGLIARYTTASPRATIESQIVNARNGGSWDQIGITSSSARNDALAVTTLGVLEGTEYQSVHGPAAPFFGTATDDTMVLVKYTYYGDTDFNGFIDGDDYSRTDSGFNLGLTGWLNGDADLNGFVDGDDYALIDAAFNLQSGTLRDATDWLAGHDPARDLAGSSPAIGRVQKHFQQFGSSYAQTFLSVIPEPTVAALSALVIAAGMIARHRPRGITLTATTTR